MMMHIPSLLLAKLYVKRSLRNEGEGFEFAIRNVLAPGTVVKFLGVNVDGREYRPHEVYLLMNDMEAIGATEISAREPLALDLGQDVRVKVCGDELSAGPHQIVLRFLTREVGQVNAPFHDTIAG